MRDRLPPLVARAADLVRLLASLADDTGLRPPLTTLADAFAAEPVVPPDPAEGIGARVGLSPFEYDVLVLVGLPEEHEAVARLFRLLGGHPEGRATVATIATVLALDGPGRRHLHRAVEGGPLHRHLLVAGPDTVPLPERGLRLPTGLWSVLRGVDHWPSPLRPLPLRPIAGPPLAGIGAAAGGEPLLVVVTGEGRTDVELASLATGALAGTTVAVPAADVDDERAASWSAHVLARSAVPVVVGTPTGPPLPRHPGPVVVATPSTTGLAMDDRPTVTIEVEAPDLGDAVAMWHRLLPELNGQSAPLAGLLRVGELGARRAVVDSRAASSPVSIESVVTHVRHRTDVVLPRSVRLVRPRATLGQLVVTEEQERLLGTVIHRVRGQATVLHEWGFSSAARHRGGVRVLLAGPPGTGKTLAVEAVAAELHLDLLVVDLSALVSKWLGETEKNIAEVFDAAERCQAVLFFDEADAVFGRRTDGSDAQARWANLETAYLLSRIDRSDGLVALATNLRRNIDDAFLRRLDVVIELDEPDRALRERLWRMHLPHRAPLAADVDLGTISAMYEITGGTIRNASLAAAFGAAAGARPIDQAGLIHAVHDEYRKAGRSFPGTPRATAARVRGGT